MELAFLGGYGSDGPGWYIGPDGVPHYFEGWGIEALGEIRLAVAILDLAAKFKNPELAKAVSGRLGEFVRDELAAFVGERAILAG